MLQLKNLTKHYHHKKSHVVGINDVSLTINKGEIFGIIGKSGAGKSTLIRCLNLLERPTGGEIILNSTNLIKLNKKQLQQQRRKIGMIFQHFNLLSSRTVFDNIALPLKLSGKSAAEIKQAVEPLLELTGLTNKQDAYPAQLSGGQKQRVAIARALVCEPEMLLCDEATSALDPQTTQSILNLLKKINQQLGLTIVIITHEMQVIKDIADRVAVLDHGKLVEMGDVLNVFTQPQTEITRQLINAALRLDLPENIRTKLHNARQPEHYPLLRFTFVGNEISKPFLSQLSEKMKINFNILQANIELIHGNPVGFMLVQAIASEEQLPLLLDYAKQHDLTAEVLGYVL